MSGETTTPNPGTQASTDEVPTWFKAYQERADANFKDLTQRVGRINERTKEVAPDAGGATPPDKTQEPVATGSGSEYLAALELGELRAKLPEKARGNLDAKIKAGLKPSEAKAWAQEALDLIASSTPAKTDTKAEAGATPVQLPTGDAATAAPSSSTHQWTRQGLWDLKTKEPAKYHQEVKNLAARGVSLSSLPLK